MCPSGLIKKVYEEKRSVFKEERNKCRFGQDRSASEREFQIDGAAKEKERRPLADQIIEVSQARTESRDEDKSSKAGGRVRAIERVVKLCIITVKVI
jgi:hypothetical protein